MKWGAVAGSTAARWWMVAFFFCASCGVGSTSQATGPQVEDPDEVARALKETLNRQNIEAYPAPDRGLREGVRFICSFGRAAMMDDLSLESADDLPEALASKYPAQERSAVVEACESALTWEP